MSLTTHKQILWEDIRSVGTLENRVLSVELQVPSYDEEAIVGIVNYEQLDKILNTSCEYVLNPNFSSRCDCEVDGFHSVSIKHRILTLNVLYLASALDNEVIAEQPGTIHLQVSSLQASEIFGAAMSQANALLFSLDFAFKDGFFGLTFLSCEAKTILLLRIWIILIYTIYALLGDRLSFVIVALSRLVVFDVNLNDSLVTICK